MILVVILNALPVNLQIAFPRRDFETLFQWQIQNLHQRFLELAKNQYTYCIQ